MLNDAMPGPGEIGKGPFRGPRDVRSIATLAAELARLGYLPTGPGLGLLDGQVEAAVRRFQMKGIGANGLPLKVDGIVGVQTRFGLDVALGRAWEAPNACLPPPRLDGPPAGASASGWAALQTALGEIERGAQEIGGVGAGAFCRVYLEAAGLGEGRDWSVPFVAWCLGEPGVATARGYLARARMRGWSTPATPLAGDIMLWTSPTDPYFCGHAAIIAATDCERLYTVEAGRTPFVEFFHHDRGAVAPLVTLVRPSAREP